MFGKSKDPYQADSSFYQRIRNSYIVIAVAYVVFGLGLLIKPEASTTIICYAVGSLCIIYAAATLIKYFTDSRQRSFFEPGFILSVLLGIFGLVTVIRPAVIISILPTIVGIILVVSGLIKLQDSLSLKKYGCSRWQTVLLFALVSVAFGVVILLNPFGTGLLFIRMVGLFFVVDGLLSISSTIMMRGSR